MQEDKHPGSSEKEGKSGKTASLPLTLVLPIIVVLLLVAGGGVYLGMRAQKKTGNTDNPVLSSTPVITSEVTPGISVKVENSQEKSSPTVKPSAVLTATSVPSLTPTNTPTPTGSLKIVPKISLKLIATATPLPLPDLYVSDFKYNNPPITPKFGQQFTARISIYNGGNGPSGSFYWEYWPQTGVKACREKITSLVAHGGLVVTCNYTYNNDFAGYQGKVFVDVDNQVTESDESNNTKSVPTTPTN